MMVSSSPASMSASSAPMPAEGSVERIVIGWMKLSYSTPSTMYMTTTAASSSSNSLIRLLRNASAAPWKVVLMLAGRPTARCCALDGLDARAQRGARSEIERHGAGRKLRLVIDQQRADVLTGRRQSPTAAPGRRRRRAHRSRRATAASAAVKGRPR